MSIINDITSHDTRSLLIGGTLVRVGDHLGTYADDADEQTSLPIVLVDGSTVSNDQDRDELRSALQRLGLGVETDDTGLVLVQTSTAR